MAYGSTNQITIPGLVATGDLSSKQYYAVKMASTANAVKVAVLAADQVIGILQNDPTDGQPALVCAVGVSKVVRGTTLAVGAHVAADTTGRVQTTTTANDTVIGLCIEPASSAGDLATIFVGGPSNY